MQKKETKKIQNKAQRKMNRQEKKQFRQRNKGNVINDLPHGDAPGEEINSNDI